MSSRGVAALGGAFLLLLFPTSAFASSSCVERSDIVGLEHCKRFGHHWALEAEPPILFVFGMRYSEVGTGNATFSEDVGKRKVPDGYTPYRYSGESLGLKSLHGIGVEGGIQFFAWRQLYTGIQSAVVFGETRLASFQTSNGLELSGDTGINVTTFSGAIPIGYRIALGRFALRPEIDFGIETLSVSHRIAGAPPGEPDSGTASAFKFLVEPRLSADLWLTQHVLFGGYAAINALDENGHGRAFGLALTWHNRAFDGDTF